MNVLVCVKRVPSPGSRIVLTEDGLAVDTQHLGFTVSPHEECAVEEAVRIVEQHGGTSSVLTLGPEAAQEQLRMAISMGVDDGVLLPIDAEEWDPQATATAIVAAIRSLEADGAPFDLILFGDESADAGHHQVGIRVAHALARPIVAGIKAIAFEEGGVRVDRDVSEGFEIHQLPLPAVVAVKEGINLPRYPAMRGRLKAAKAQLRRIEPEAPRGGLTTLRLHHPVQDETETVMLGQGAGAAAAVVGLFEEMGLV
jgi:electron transfer flavoprotein beta subunit